ncbi:hypothetical protein ACFSQ7_20650 [Paenibacillus rhizoplanae]
MSSNAPASYPLGVTEVTWTAKDVNGNVSTRTQKGYYLGYHEAGAYCAGGSRQWKQRLLRLQWRSVWQRLRIFSR